MLTARGIDVLPGLKSEEAQDSFYHLKYLFSTRHFLIHVDFSLPLVIHVDSSGYAYSVILSQENANGELRPVAYFSRKLNPAEGKWQVHAQELGAIVACFEEWPAWLMGTAEPVTVFSDHVNLRYFMKAQSLTAKQARWASFLSQFLFDIVHIPGKQNLSDPASRRSDYVGKDVMTNRIILLVHREQNTVYINAVQLQKLKVTSIHNPISSFIPADEKTLISLRALYDTDEFLKGHLPTALTYRDHVWWWRDKIYVPKSMQNLILEQVHNKPLAGHWGSMKTFDLLTRNFDWPNARADVLKFCMLCQSCQSIKVDH